MKGIRVLFMAVLLTLVLGGSAIQAQDEVDLSQPGNVKITYVDGSQIWCTTDVLDNGWGGGMFIPPPNSPSPSVWASCNVAYDMADVVMVTFSPIADLDLVFDLECADNLVPDSPEMFCRVRSS